MKKEYELYLPDSCKVLKNDEMIQAEGGWYIDISEKTILLSTKDLNNISKLKKLLPIMKEQCNIDLDMSTLQNLINFPVPTPGKMYGIGISFKSNNPNVWALKTLKEKELANSNKIVF